MMSKDDTSNPITEKPFDIDITKDVLEDLGDPGIEELNTLEEFNAPVQDSELEGVSGGGGGGGMALIYMLAAPMTIGSGSSSITITNDLISNAKEFTIGGKAVSNMQQFRAALSGYYKSGATAQVHIVK